MAGDADLLFGPGTPGCICGVDGDDKAFALGGVGTCGGKGDLPRAGGGPLKPLAAGCTTLG